ncbi:MAG: hypothetical protein LBJ73_03075 [Rickettsiales bacterium]|nr:hypothetical protein [Rickettsiales bacterium]
MAVDKKIWTYGGIGLGALIVGGLISAFIVKGKATEAHEKSKKHSERIIDNANGIISRQSGELNAIGLESDMRRKLIEHLLSFIMKRDPQVQNAATEYFALKDKRAALQDSINSSHNRAGVDSLYVAEFFNQRTEVDSLIKKYDGMLNDLFRGYASPENKALLKGLLDKNTLVLPDSVWMNSENFDQNRLANELKVALQANDSLRTALANCGKNTVFVKPGDKSNTNSNEPKTPANSAKVTTVVPGAGGGTTVIVNNGGIYQSGTITNNFYNGGQAANVNGKPASSVTEVAPTNESPKPATVNSNPTSDVTKETVPVAKGKWDKYKNSQFSGTVKVITESNQR